MRMSELMTPDVQTVKPSASANEAFALMRRKGIRHLVVTNGSGIAGVLSERDAGGRAGASAREGRTVADLMTTTVVTRAPGDTVRSAANVMRGRSIGCLPIVDRGRLVGIVTLSDMLDALAHGGDRPRVSAPRAALHWRVPHKKSPQRRRAW